MKRLFLVVVAAALIVAASPSSSEACFRLRRARACRPVLRVVTAPFRAVQTVRIRRIERVQARVQARVQSRCASGQCHSH